MKVKELIEILQTKDPEALVLLGADYGAWDVDEIEDVKVSLTKNEDEPWVPDYQELPEDEEGGISAISLW